MLKNMVFDDASRDIIENHVESIENFRCDIDKSAAVISINVEG